MKDEGAADSPTISHTQPPLPASIGSLLTIATMKVALIT